MECSCSLHYRLFVFERVRLRHHHYLIKTLLTTLNGEQTSFFEGRSKLREEMTAKERVRLYESRNSRALKTNNQIRLCNTFGKRCRKSYPMGVRLNRRLFVRPAVHPQHSKKLRSFYGHSYIEFRQVHSVGPSVRPSAHPFHY